MFFLIYLLRIATTGSIVAACEAGMMPAIIPTARHIRKVHAILPTDIKIGKFSALVSICVSKKTKSNPINPPIMQRKADSNKNSVSMILCFAPIAFFKPICPCVLLQLQT